MKKYRILLLALLIAIPALQAFCGNGKYTVDPKKSSVKWSASKITGKHNGHIQVKEGTFSMDNNKISKGKIIIDMSSIVDEDLTDSTRNAQLITHLMSEDFFSVKKFNEAVFELKKCEPLKNDHYTLTGKLTIKGITQEISCDATIKQFNNFCVILCKITIDRTKFDIKYRSASIFSDLGDKAISDQFELQVSILGQASAK